MRKSRTPPGLEPALRVAGLGGELMSAKGHPRNWGAKTNVTLIFGALAAVLLIAALVTAVAVDPPTLGWVGFAIAAIIAFNLGILVTLLIPRMRVSAPRPVPAFDHQRRLLVVADAHCSATALCQEIEAHLEDVTAVHLVVPIRVSHLHFLTNDELAERREARRTMVIAVGLLKRHPIAVSGSVGTDKPIESMADALGTFPATHVLLAIPPEDEQYWLERDLLAKAQALTDVPVAQAVVSSKQLGGLEQAQGGSRTRRRETTPAPQRYAKE
jgi:hypothetical protein